MKNDKGVYVVKGKSYPMLEGSRVQVPCVSIQDKWRSDQEGYFKNKRIRYVVKKHKTAKKEKRLEKAGYKTERTSLVRRRPPKIQKEQDNEEAPFDRFLIIYYFASFQYLGKII